MKINKNFLLTSLILAVFVLLQNGVVSAVFPRIYLTPNPVIVNEGSSQVITVTLDEPIIAQSGSGTVELDFASSDPARVSVSPSTLIFHALTWADPQTFTINTVHNSAFGDDEEVLISATAISNSEYYSGYQVSEQITLKNIDPNPNPVVTATPATTPQDAATWTDQIPPPAPTTSNPADKTPPADNMLHPSFARISPVKANSPKARSITPRWWLIIALTLIAAVYAAGYITIKKQWFIWRLR